MRVPVRIHWLLGVSFVGAFGGNPGAWATTPCESFSGRLQAAAQELQREFDGQAEHARFVREHLESFGGIFRSELPIRVVQVQQRVEYWRDRAESMRPGIEKLPRDACGNYARARLSTLRILISQLARFSGVFQTLHLTVLRLREAQAHESRARAFSESWIREELPRMSDREIRILEEYFGSEDTSSETRSGGAL